MKKTVKRGKKPPLARRSHGGAAAATRRMEQVGLGMSLGEQVVVAPKPRVDPSAWDVAAMVQARIHRANAVGELNEAQNDLIEATRVAFEAQHAAIEAPHRNANVERASRRVHEAAKALAAAANEYARVWRGTELYNLPAQIQAEVETATRRARFEERKPNRRRR